MIAPLPDPVNRSGDRGHASSRAGDRVSAPSAAGAYRALLHLYPRRFRAEYGPDMALLFANQLRDEAGVCVWARTLVDVAINVPTQHLELT